MSRKLKVAVAGATGLVGEALLECLANSQLPLGEVVALASDRSIGREVAYGDDSLPVNDLAAHDFAGFDLALFAAGAEVAHAHVPRALDAGCAVVDLSTAFRDESGVPLVVPAVNADVLAQLGPRRLVASPGGATVALVSALAPLHALAGVERVNLVVLESASGAGRGAVEELARQCAMLLNGRPLAEGKGAPAQVAFDCVPRVGDWLAGGQTTEEAQIAADTARILGDPSIKVNSTVVRVPVFFGDGLVVHLETREPLGLERAREALAAVPGLRLEQEAPSLAQAAADRDAVLAGRLRADPTHPRGIDFWLAADNVRRGSAANTVEIVEVLVRDIF
ncbi:MAG: aspartate-semialdehyde dehydrogenase [Steroidobacteraceae bacterium]|nr:aspartate-semialdehyde dehydrogenase [Steroidobacteraceae bacterium]